MGTRWGAPPWEVNGGLVCLLVPGLDCCVTGDSAGKTGHQAVSPTPCLQYKPGKSKMCQGQEPASYPAQSWAQRDTGDIFLTPFEAERMPAPVISSLGRNQNAVHIWHYVSDPAMKEETACLTPVQQR